MHEELFTLTTLNILSHFINVEDLMVIFYMNIYLVGKMSFCSRYINHKEICYFSTLRSLLRQIIAVGVKASDRKWERGNQNQNWVKTSRPTTDGMWV